MEKAHDVQDVSLVAAILRLRVDGKRYEVDVTRESKRLADATPEQRPSFQVSPAGYGILWPDIHKDLAIDGLIGVKRPYPLAKAKP